MRGQANQDPEEIEKWANRKQRATPEIYQLPFPHGPAGTRLCCNGQKNLYRPPKPVQGDRFHRDIKRNYAFHKDIGHTTNKCVALKDKIKRFIRASYFKEFMDDPQVANQEERPRQRSLEKVREVLTIISGLYLAKQSHHAREKYANNTKNPLTPSTSTEGRGTTH